MVDAKKQAIVEDYMAYLHNKSFPCVAARAAAAKQHVKCLVASDMHSAEEDETILQFLYDFVDAYRVSTGSFYSAAVVFEGPELLDEEIFDELCWQRLQSLADLDAENYAYDKRVDADPSSPNFSFSLKEEAFFIIGLHPSSSRASRQFRYPALVFNPHAEFEKLRHAHTYENMKEVVRKRDVAYSGSINPMLADFGKVSEVYQYSGRKYEDNWQCPLKINHGKIKHNSPS